MSGADCVCDEKSEWQCQVIVIAAVLAHRNFSPLFVLFSPSLSFFSFFFFSSVARLPRT